MFIKSVMHPTISSLLPPFPPAFNLSQHHGLCQWVSALPEMAKVLEFQLQHQSFQWIFRADFLLDWIVLSPCSPRDSQESSPTLQFKSINYSVLSLLYGPTLTSINDYWKNHSFDFWWTFIRKVMSLLFNMLSRLVIAFLPRSNHLLISWLQSPSAMVLEPPKIKSVIVSIVSQSIFHEVRELDAMILVFWMFSFKPILSLSSFNFINKLFSSSLSAIRVVLFAYLRLLIFLPTILIPAGTSSSPAFHMIYSAYK